jgi:Uma2 family endonuclease
MVVNVVQVERRLITVDEYEQMVKAGVFREDDRLELIEGDLVKMSPIGAAHAGYVKRLNRLLSQQVSGNALIAIQDPVRLIRSEPEPDIALLRPRADDYIDSLPQAADIVLVVEVADTSVDYDRQVKLPLYAAAGITEAWLLDLNRRVVEVHRQPGEAGYAEKRTLRAGDQLTNAALPGFALGLNELFADIER